MSERTTPRTDAALIRYGNHILDLRPHGTVVTAHFAGTLERENAELREALEYALPDSENSSVIFDAEKLASLRALLAATKGNA